MRGLLIGIFFLLNAVAICITAKKNQPTYTIILKVPEPTYAQWQRTGSLTCTLAEHYKDKVENTQRAALMLGSVRNPEYDRESSTHKGDSFLAHQKFVFLYCPRKEPKGSYGNQRVYVEIPEDALMEAVSSGRITIPFA